MTFRSIHILALVAGVGPWSAGAYGLKDYLSQVAEKHQGLLGSQAAAKAAAAKTEEVDLVTAPTVFAQSQWLRDSKPTATPSFQGTKTSADVYSLGVGKMFGSGTTLRYTYSLSRTEIEGVNLAVFPQPKFFDGRGALEISQSLWRNGFGSEVNAQQDAARAGLKATRWSESFRGKMLLMEAELTYARLALARSAVALQKDSLDRAKRIREWAAGREERRLSDTAEKLQAEAGLKAKELEYKTAIDEEQAARRAFNSLRGQDSDAVEEALEGPFDLNIPNLPEQAPPREDIEAAEAVLQATEAASLVGLEKARPSLDLTGSFALNGRDTEMSPALGNSFDTDHPTYAFGLRFSMPLDASVVRGIRDGYAADREAARLNWQRKKLEAQVEWSDIRRRLDSARERAKLSDALEKAQKAKLDHERTRLDRGRTTTYQVVLFEQDYATAQLLQLQTRMELFRAGAAARTYHIEGESQ